MTLFLADDQSPLWSQYTGTWVVGTVGEIVLAATLIRSRPSTAVDFDNAALALQILRLIFLLALVGYALFCRWTTESSSTKDVEVGNNGAPVEESPLLSGESTLESTTTAGQLEGRQYGAMNGTSNSEDGDDDDEEKEAKELEKKRIEAGGWWGYVKGFSLFLPYLWPRKQPKIQLYLLLIGLCIAAERVFNVLIPRQEGIIVDKLTQVHGTGELPWKEVAFWFFLKFLDSRATFGMLQHFFEFHLDNWSLRQMTDLIFRHIMNLSMDFHVSKDSGELIRAVEQGSSLNMLVRMLLFDFGPIFLDIGVSLVYISYLFDDIYFACIMIVSAVFYAIATWKGNLWGARKRRVYAEDDRQESKTKFESISNWTTVSYFNRTRYQHGRLMTSLENMIASSTVLFNIQCAVDAARVLSLFLGYLCINFLAVYRISQGTKPVGTFVTLNSYWHVFSGPLWFLSYLSTDITTHLVNAERVLQVLKSKPTITDSQTARPLRVENGEVRFENVSFSYDKRKDTIKDVSFIAKPRQMIALVGETGSGKSTIFKLLFRFYDVTGGSITIDGSDLRDVTLSSLRDAIGVVPQDASLFNTSIMENVRFARLDASDDDVMAACKAACIHDKIMSFPDKYKTKVGERGVKLSGGELQRVSIARVILKNPQIVLLDEATSAVDSSTEAHIQDAFRKFTEHRTTFVIAHRLSTIMDADTILVVDKGEIVERGTHEELTSAGGKYQQLWEAQTTKVKKTVEESKLLLDI
ncbi:P-loop containing nucleoside triphosphate hydrolase protein [Elaphomyces granulatus]